MVAGRGSLQRELIESIYLLVDKEAMGEFRIPLPLPVEVKQSSRCFQKMLTLRLRHNNAILLSKFVWSTGPGGLYLTWSASLEDSMRRTRGTRFTRWSICFSSKSIASLKKYTLTTLRPQHTKTSSASYLSIDSQGTPTWNP